MPDVDRSEVDGPIDDASPARRHCVVQQPPTITPPRSAPTAPARPTKHELLDAAKAATADRGLNYGSPEDNFNRIAALWTTHLENRGNPAALDAHDVAMMMALMKVARLQNDPHHLDSWTDLAGYAACGANLP